MYLSFYCNVCVWEGVGDRTETAIYWPHSYGHQCFVFLVLLMLNRRAGGQLCWLSLLHLYRSPDSIGGPEGPFGPHLVSITSDLQLSGPNFVIRLCTLTSSTHHLTNVFIRFSVLVIQDYPSIDHISQVVHKHKVTVIFAVAGQEHQSLYHILSNSLVGSYVSQLGSKNSTIANIVTKGYKVSLSNTWFSQWTDTVNLSDLFLFSHILYHFWLNIAV